MSNIDPVKAALAAAQEAQQNMSVPAVATQAAAPVYAPAPAAAPAPRRPTLDDLDNQGMIVDKFLKFEKTGIQVDKVGFHETIKVGIDLSQCQAIYAVSFGNPAQYRSSVDGVRDRKGGDWQATLARAANDPARQGSEYLTVEVVMTILEDAVDVKGNKAEAGTVVGYTPSVTGVKEFTKFKQAAMAAGLTRAMCEVGYMNTSNTKGSWAKATFKFLGPWED